MYLDTKGLLAVWREGLLAKKVLEGRTNGYRNHPQLFRFRQSKNPAGAINAYLQAIHNEAKKRGYNFSRDKIGPVEPVEKIPLTAGQAEFERLHLLGKLRKRDMRLYGRLSCAKTPKANPLFRKVRGKVEAWEKI